MQKNSNLIIAIVAILIILGGVAFMFDSRKNQDKSSVQQGDSINPADSSNVAYNNYTQDGVDETPEEELIPVASPGNSNEPPKPAPRLTYTEVLDTYGPQGNNNRFVITGDCQINPTSLTVKKNSRFVLDNRDSELHTFKIGPKAIRLNKFAFSVITAREKGELEVKCDGTTRATLIVE